jgi:hypothetical protein
VRESTADADREPDAQPLTVPLRELEGLLLGQEEALGHTEALPQPLLLAVEVPVAVVVAVGNEEKVEVLVALTVDVALACAVPLHVAVPEPLEVADAVTKPTTLT